MARVRPPAVAGRFYPAGPETLRAEVCRYLARAVVEKPDAGGSGGDTSGPGSGPSAIVAPHAGYVFSGPVAGSVYATLAADPGRYRRVVIVGPAHYVAIRGLAVPTASAFATPLGDVPVDEEGVARALELDAVEKDDRVHAPEHALEVQLPFLQEVLEPGFTVLPILAGLDAEGPAAAAIDALWEGPETLVVVSTDLSHYLTYDAATRRDARTAAAVEALEADAVGPDDACGFLPLRGLLRVARTRGLACRKLDLRNSADTGGPRDRVVGYGAFALS